MSDFKILSDSAHIRLRAPMYAGSVSTQETKVFLNGEFQTLPVNEGLLKIISEILDNSLDEAVRTQFKYANIIKFTVDSTSVSVSDNGRGIPIELIQDQNGVKIHRPVAAWSRARAGSNFDDSNRTSIGANGVGSFLTNCLSTSFTGTTEDGKERLEFRAAKGETLEVKTSKSSKHGTSVHFTPDLEFFGVTEIDSVHISLLEERIRALSIAFPQIRFSFNGTTTKVKKPEEYYNTMYSIRTSENAWFGLSRSKGSFDTSSIVNGLIIPNGGSHIDYFVSGVCTELSTLLKRRKKVDLTPAKIKSYLNCYSLITGFNALKFDSQTKTKITNSAGEIKAHVGEVDFAKIAAALFKSEELISEILAYTKFQEDLEARKSLEKLEKPKKKIILPNLLNSVGRPNRLFLVEGLSAMAGLSPAFGRQGNSYFALKGVPLNGYECTHQEMAANKELGTVYQLVKSLSDDLSIVIAADEDADGQHIRGLLLAFFYRYMPEMFEQGRISVLSTPIAVQYKNGKPERWSYTFNGISELKGEVHYMKGLGSWTADTLKPVIAADGIESMIKKVITPSKTDLDAWFLNENADRRKDLIQAGPAFNIMKL